MIISNNCVLVGIDVCNFDQFPHAKLYNADVRLFACKYFVQM